MSYKKPYKPIGLSVDFDINKILLSYNNGFRAFQISLGSMGKTNDYVEIASKVNSFKRNRLLPNDTILIVYTPRWYDFLNNAEESADDFILQIKYAHELGAKYIISPAEYRISNEDIKHRKNKSNPPFEVSAFMMDSIYNPDRVRFSNSIKPVIDKLRKTGITLCLESSTGENSFPFHERFEILALTKHIVNNCFYSNVGFCLNTQHEWAFGQLKKYDSLPSLAEYAEIIHLNSNEKEIDFGSHIDSKNIVKIEDSHGITPWNLRIFYEHAKRGTPIILDRSTIDLAIEDKKFMETNWGFNYMSKPEMPNVQWYGERGIINALLNYLRNSDEGFNKVVQKLLTCVKWANNKAPDWIQGIQSANAIVEIGLHDFGDPDLILICKHYSGKRYCVFIEAKVSTYRDSMKSNKIGMTQKAYNSSINGQLSLKYRFSIAMQDIQKNGSIQESQDLFNAYQKNLKETNKDPRKIAKQQVLNVLENHGIPKIPANNCYFVALTWDRDSADNIFYSDNDVIKDGEFLPLFLDENADVVFMEVKDRLGWLGYKAINDMLGVMEDPEFHHTFVTMRGSLYPGEGYYNRVVSKVKRISNHHQKIYQEFINHMLNQFENIDFPVRTASISIIKQGIVIGKIVPLDDINTFIGFLTNELDIAAHAYIEKGDFGNMRYKSSEFKGLIVNNTTLESKDYSAIMPFVNAVLSNLL